MLDLRMAGRITGEDALATLRADPATAQIPIIVVTANAYPEDIARIMSMGAVAYIEKPVNFDLLYAAVETARARRSNLFVMEHNHG